MAEYAPGDAGGQDWPPLSANALGPGTCLGRYELLVPIAYGGMARVWAARQHGTRGFTKLVAVKTILPHLARDARFERMFLDEARIAAGIHHPNVCEIYELGEEGQVLYLAMEWVNGDSLVHVLRATGTVEPLEPRIAARIAADACAGLHAAHNLADDEGHALGVVHRDVSPHNVLLSTEGTVKVMDFGVAKALGQIHDATAAGQIKGKVTYMAPEQITGTTIDRRSDVFSVGCMLYEATIGTPPFRGVNDPQMMQAILRGVYAPPSELVRGYPPELERIVVRSLSLDPRQRFPTADKLGTALGEWLARSGPLVTPAHLAAVVKGRLGGRIEKRREQIRVASTMTPAQGTAGVRGPFPSRPPPDVTPSGPASAAPRAQTQSGVITSGSMPAAPVPVHEPIPISYPPPSPQSIPIVQLIGAPEEEPSGLGVRYAIAAAIGVGFAVLVGVSGLAVWRSSHPAAGSPSMSTSLSRSASQSSSPSTPLSPSLVPPAPTATATATASEPSSERAAAAPGIDLEVTPDFATITVDGVPLPAGVHAVPRPPAGQTTTIVVRALGYEERAMGLDAETADAVPIVLDRAKKATSAPGAVVPPPGGPPAPARPPVVPGLPENPY